MMQAIDLWNGDDSSDPARHDGARVGAIFVERKMRAAAVIVIEVRGHEAAQMALIKDHYVIQTLAANRTDHALDVCVLPR